MSVLRGEAVVNTLVCLPPFLCFLLCKSIFLTWRWGADSMGEKANAFVFSFLLQITRFIRNTDCLDCKDHTLSKVLLGVSVLLRFWG